MPILEEMCKFFPQLAVKSKRRWESVWILLIFLVELVISAQNWKWKRVEEESEKVYVFSSFFHQNLTNLSF